MDKDLYPHIIIIELSYLDEPIAKYVGHQITTIAEGLFGPLGKRWNVQLARNDMVVEFVRRGDLHSLWDRLDDLGWEGILERSECRDISLDEVEEVADE